MSNYIGLSSLLGTITADLRIRRTPCPTFTFEEWLAIRRELSDLMAEAEHLRAQRLLLLRDISRNTPSFADTSDD